MATKQEIIDRLSQCGGLSYQDWIVLLDSIFFDGDLGDLIVFPSSQNVLPNLTGDFKRIAFLSQGTYTQTGGSNIVVGNDKMLSIAGWDNINKWREISYVNMPNVSSKITEWTAGTYSKDSSVTVNKKIYRSNKYTSQAPVTGGVVGTDWDLIGGSEINLDVSGGAFSYEKGTSIEKALKSFLQSSMQTIDVSSQRKDGYLINIDNSIRTTDDPNNGAYHNLNVKDWSFLDINFVRLRTAIQELKSIIGIKSDGSIDVLDQPSDAETAVHLNINIEPYEYVSINYNRIRSVLPTVLLSKTADAGEAQNPEDSVKNYIDNAIQPLQSLKETKIGYTPTKLNGVDAIYLASGVNSLRKDNTHVYVATNDYSTILWKDVPTAGMGDFLRVKAIRPGGGANLNCVFVGKLKGSGSFDPIGVSIQQNDTDVLENFQIDLTKYQSFSLVIGNKKSSNVGLGSEIVFVDNTKPEKTLTDHIYDYSKLIAVSNGVFNIDLSNGKNYHLASTGANVSFNVSGVSPSDYVTIFVCPAVDVNSVTITNSIILWQNNESPLLEAGKGYFITLNTFRAGASWVASLVKAWDNSNGNII